MYKCIFIAVVLGAFGGYIGAVADEAFTLDDIVVTPMGSETDAFDTPLPINQVSLEEIEKQIAVSVKDLLKMEPGVDVVTTGPNSVHPMIRGLFGERVLVLVDGIRLSEQRPGGNHAFSLDAAQIERVEIVRGPASVLYGSDAIGGVVNFITRRADTQTGPEARFSGNTDVRYQSNGEGWKGAGHMRLGKDRYNGYLGGVYTDTADMENRDGKINNSAYDGYTLWGGGNYIGETWRAFADYSYMNADIGVPSPEIFAEDLFKREKHQRLALRLDQEDIAETTGRMSVDFGWQRHNRHRYRRKVAEIPPALAGDLEINIWLDIDTYTLKPQWVFMPNDAHRATVGIDTFYEKATSDRTLRDSDSAWVNPAFDKVPPIPDSSRVGVGVFAQDEVFLGDRWVFTPGLRADWIRSQTDGDARHQIADDTSSENSALSGNVGLLYKINNELNVYGNIGRAFRAPTLLELYFFGPHDVANDVGDPDLKPETSWNFDLGIKARTDRLQGMVSAFYTIIDDYIVKEKQENGDYMYKNYAQVYLYGGEAGLDYELGGGVSVFASLSCVYGKNDKTDDYLPSIPPLKAHYGLRYDLALGDRSDLWLEVSGVTAADQDKTDPRERETDGYTLGHVRMGLDVGATWSLMAAVENVTDELYQDHLSMAWQEFGMNDQPGRNVKLLLKAAF